MSDPGSFSQCILEGAPESGTQAKWLRGKSLAISLVIEATLLSALLLLPLFATAVLPPVFVVTPAPPYRAQPKPPQRISTPASPRQPSGIFTPIYGHPLLRPSGEHLDAAPIVGTSIGDRMSPTGPGIPGGQGRGATVSLSAPRTVSRDRPMRQSEGVMTARLLLRVQPEYPRLATLLHLSGVVRLRAIIGTDGSVQQLEVLSGNPILTRAAVLAVRQWRYEPTQLNGQPVEVETSITVTFVLD
ncbi:MAG: TonB family protein [Candidatus Acidiferrales bacterium]